VALVGVLALAVAGIATAASKDGVTFTSKFTSKKAETSTGVNTVINSEGTKDPATGKPKATRTVTVTFPKGTTFNTKVYKYCTKAALQAKGLAGCSSKTRVGPKNVNAGAGNEKADGKAEAVTGLAAIDPVKVGVYAFNRKNGILFYIQPNTGQPGNPFVIEGTLKKNVLNTPVPKLPQPTPFGEAILTKFEVNIAKKGNGDKAFVLTGPCPKSKKWSVRYKASFDTGSTTVVDTYSCRA
jgi:hypothetical protein